LGLADEYEYLQSCEESQLEELQEFELEGKAEIGKNDKEEVR
jgi:hypothetical protein